MPKSSKTPGLGRRMPPSEVLFGTPEEVTARDTNNYPSDPKDNAPSFKQIGPSLSGGSANKLDRGAKHVGGNFKFSGGV